MKRKTVTAPKRKSSGRRTAAVTGARISAVSYTHLDVYKRQRPDRRMFVTGDPKPDAWAMPPRTVRLYALTGPSQATILPG